MDLMEELLTQLHLIIFKMTFQKPELIFVSPKTPEAKEVFQYDMDKLHTCRIKERKDGMMKLESISGRFVFWMNENDEDRNWKSLNK
jgi:hypothetical protein